MLKKNDEITVLVSALGSEGEGIAREGDATLFLPRCLPGETVRAKVLKVKGNIGYAKAEEILSPSPDRVTPRCPVYGKCGGCDLQHMNYAAQLAFKQKLVADCLQKIGNLSFPVAPVIASDKQWGYRNKLQLPVGTDGGKPLIGFYAARSHRIVPVQGCAIHPAWAEKLITAFSSYMEQNGVAGYDERTGRGEIRHLVVRELGGKFIVTVVSAAAKPRAKEALIGAIASVFPSFTLVYNVNAKPTNVVFGEKFVPLYGDGFFEAEEEGIRYEAGANTFVQVNDGVRAKLYAAALDMAADGDGVVIDCYAGGGLLTAMAAKRAKRAYGIEIVPEATACADALKQKNGLAGKMFNICGDVAEELPKLMERERGENVSLILDPPRAGVARAVLKAIVRAGIEKLVLISCNPATLARDLGILTGSLRETEKGELVKGDGKGAYRLLSVTPFDMFPQTKHVEAVCLLSKLHAKEHIEVN